LRDAYLILENGVVFKGRSFGYDGETVGELVFSTAMTGYLEAITDPAYYGQILLQTFPLIGNYGIIPRDFSSISVHVKAYIVREWCQEPSNFRSEGNLDSFLCDMKIPGLCGIDTRELTRVIRDNGVMNAMVSKTPELSDSQWAELRGYKIVNAIAAASGIADGYGRLQSNPFIFESRIQSAKFTVGVWNFGCAYKLLDGLITRGASPTVLGFDASADDLLAVKPDGIVLSEGPGDPAEYTRIIGEIRVLCNKSIPVLGVGLGHQMLAIANGAITDKLPFGHRGANQPVKKLDSGKVFVTMQNHGYTVAPGSPPRNALMSYINLNDYSCEGLTYTDIPAFSVQFEPTDSIFADFFAKMN